MIERVSELNRVLLVVAGLGGRASSIDLDAILDACSRTVIEGRMPDHEATLEYAQLVGLLASVDKAYSISEEGEAFLQLNPKSEYDLTDEQKRLLLRSQYLGGTHRRVCKKFFDSFEFSEMRQAYRWSVSDSKPIRTDAWLTEHLVELGALERGEGWIEVRPEHATVVSTFIDEAVGLTEEKLREFLKEKEEVGEIAERIVFEYEKKRLLGIGYKMESACVRRVGKVRVNLGYDVESFDGSSANLVYDRMIEVKGAKGSEVRFFWSDNEMKVAQLLGDRYWIYFQGGISLKQGVVKNELICFRDPHKSILGDSTLTRTSQGLLVEGKMKGKSK